jgi:WD40 repeat protein/serine/threonine protein kinase
MNAAIGDVRADRDLSGTTLGPYILRELIGEGGYGAVYRAEQPALERDVVVKVLHEQRSDSASRERFLREAKLAAQLDHPYAAHVYDFGAEDEGRLLWIAMERVRGVSLDVWLDRHGPMSPEQFGPFFEGVCEAVYVAHKQGIIHRDLKPANIMVVECGGRPRPKLLDFGIAKWHRHPEVAPAPGSDEDRAPDRDAVTTDRLPVRPRRARRTVACHDSESRRQLTPPGGSLGSPPYMALEQWIGADAVGPEADIYALAIIAYEVLTGRRLFVATRTADYFDQHKRASATRLGDAFPPALDLAIQCALDKDPRARPGTALELASDLRSALRQIKREQLRAAAQQWFDRGAAPGLLWGADVLEETLRSVPQETLSPLECAFIAASQRRIRRGRWIRRSVILLAMVGAIVGGLYRAMMQTRVAEATVTRAELEQGRSALLHNEPDAQRHLADAYRRDHSPLTAFMLARALQPRLAERARFASTFERMWSAEFSPSGKQLVTTDDRSAQVWDAQSYQLLFTLHHGDSVYHAVFSADGTKLVTGCGDGAVRIWDAATGVLLREFRRDQVQRRYYVVALSPDGKLVAGLDLGTAQVWQVDTGTPIAELRDATPSSFPSLVFSADGRWLAMSTGNDVQVLDAQTWKVVHHSAGLGIHSLSWDPTGPQLLTGSAEGDASIWAIPSGGRVHHLRELGEPIDAVAFSPDGRLVVAGSHDGTVQVWDATSAKLRSQSHSLRGEVLSVEFDQTSSLIVTSSSNGAVAVTDAASGMLVTDLEGPTTKVRVAHFEPNSQRVVGASWDGTARIWDATAPYRHWTSSFSDNCGLMTSLEPDRRFLAITCNDQPTRVWDTTHDQLVAELPSVTLVQGDFTSAYPAVSLAGDRAAIARGNNVEVYELPAARLLRTIRHGAPVNAVAFAVTGLDIVSGSIDGSVIITRDNGAMTALPTSSAGIDAAGFLADGRVVVADAGRRLRVYDLGGSTLAELQTRARVAMLRMSPDSRRLMTVSMFTDKVVAPELWDVEHYRPIAQLASPGQGQVYSARFITRDQVITACGDGAVRLWRAETGELHRTYRGGSRFLADATLSADGTMLIGGGGDGQLRFWEAASGLPLWTMPAHRSHLIGVHVEGAHIVTRGFLGDITRWSFPKPEQVIEACEHDERCAIVTQ